MCYTVDGYLCLQCIDCGCRLLHVEKEAAVCCHLNEATRVVLAYCELHWQDGSQVVFSPTIGDHSPIVPSPTLISFDYPHAKIQVPQDTNSLSQNNYKMLYATVNTTSVTVTVCICHEMRQKQNEFALMNRMREGDIFFFWCVCVACWLCYGRLFQPHHKWALMFHTGFAPEESKFVWEHLVLTDCLFYPPPVFSVKSQGHFTVSLALFSPSSFHILFLFPLTSGVELRDKVQGLLRRF